VAPVVALPHVSNKPKAGCLFHFGDFFSFEKVLGFQKLEKGFHESSGSVPLFHTGGGKKVEQVTSRIGG